MLRSCPCSGSVCPRSRIRLQHCFHMSDVKSINTSAYQISLGFAALPQYLAGRCSSNCAHLKVFSSNSQAQLACRLPTPSSCCCRKAGTASPPAPSPASGAQDSVMSILPPTAGSSSGVVTLPHFC